jgi:hypothetical protein
MHSSSATINPAKSTKSKPSQWKEKSVGLAPASVQAALREALTLESVSPTECGDFLWLIAQESGGVVGVRNARSTARGLFQLLRAQHSLNPNGEKSFGNAKEECQGGIRYVIGRYRTAHRAREFWLNHHWY